jgi:hypothetical protein
VIQGTSIEPFNLEILSVVEDIAPGRDMILARALGERMAHLGVAQGMSGSPVYVDGRLVGAVSSTWQFTREPWFGITPVEQMAEEAEWSFTHRGAGVSKDPSPAPKGAAGFRPIGSPLVLSGFDPRLVDLAAEWFRPWGFTVAEGGVSGAAQRGGGVEPGAMIGVQLAGGDVSMTAFGTVTWIDGDRVHAWGHPFFQMGDVEMPLVDGYVHATVPSDAISFKLATGGDIVGTCTGDGRSGIFGRLGAGPRTTRFDLKVTRDGVTRAFGFDLARNRYLTPQIVGLTASNAVLSGTGAVGDETVRFRQRIVLDDGRETTVETMIAGDQTVGDVANLMSEATRVILTNPFEAVKIDRLEGELVYEPGVRMGSLTEVVLDDDTLKPGGAVRGSYTLRDYRGGEQVRRFSVLLPADTPEGRYLLLVADARTAEEYEAERQPRAFAPRSLDEYLARLSGLRQTDEVHIHLYRRSTGVLLDGKPLADLPPSALAVLEGTTRSGVNEPLPAELVYEERIPAGRLVVGGHDVLLDVRKEKP